jgi:hypothetical protein
MPEPIKIGILIAIAATMLTALSCARSQPYPQNLHLGVAKVMNDAAE